MSAEILSDKVPQGRTLVMDKTRYDRFARINPDIFCTHQLISFLISLNLSLSQIFSIYPFHSLFLSIYGIFSFHLPNRYFNWFMFGNPLTVSQLARVKYHRPTGWYARLKKRMSYLKPILSLYVPCLSVLSVYTRLQCLKIILNVSFWLFFKKWQFFYKKRLVFKKRGLKPRKIHLSTFWSDTCSFWPF